MFLKCFVWILICEATVVLSVPGATLNVHSAAADRFQNAVQQQSFQTILLAIEERLRNLDSIYSMQLSETLKSKMDLYHRQLESLDTKIIRLESLVMLNLDKISENISTKNYKDDVTKTQTHKKLENVYDGLNHRMNYMDRKFDLAFDKIQNKVDLTLQRLERMEEHMIQRNADIESELSDALSILEDYKMSTANTEVTLLNITNMLQETKPNEATVQAINLTIEYMMENFNQSISKEFESLQNITLKTLNVTGETNIVIHSMKEEIKQDFNAYANKVADMNVDIWKQKDIAEESLKTIETVTNSTRNEVQNGVRALMLQIGKTSGKGIMNNDKLSLESLKKSVNQSLERIITNQELFLESCHRVQMDESQIESEISVLLGKLIDMLEKKMTTVMKDLKTIEKAVKNHDSKAHRNLYQANANIISLFNKTSRAQEFNEKELSDIKFYIDSLFTFVQDVLPRTKVKNSTEDLLNVISLNITSLIGLINTSNAYTTRKWDQLESNFSNNKVNDKFVNQMVNSTDIILNNKLKLHLNLTENINTSLREIRKLIEDLQMTIELGTVRGNKASINTNMQDKNNTQSHTKKKCYQNYGDSINARAAGLICVDDIEYETGHNKVQKAIQVDDEQLKKNILNIFGTPPPVSRTEKPQSESKVSLTKTKTNCLPKWAKLMNIRFDDTEPNNEPCNETTTKTKSKRRRNKPKLSSRFHDDDDDSLTDDQIDEDDDYENSDLTESATEFTTEIIETEMPVTEMFEDVATKA